MKATIVVPTIRENSIREFLKLWEPEFDGHNVIIVEDNPRRTFKLPSWVRHVSWEEIDKDLKEKSWIIPRRTGAIRNYGMLLAGRNPTDMIVLLDDDCLPQPDLFLEEHWRALETPGATQPIFDTMFAGQEEEEGYVRPRGYPKNKDTATTMLNHGLWEGIPDLDGETQMQHCNISRWLIWYHSIQVPPSVLFPMSAMNVAFRPELLPAMYQLPMGEGQPYHRFDDIWCGLIMKKACDAMGWSVRSGTPFISHERASDPRRNAELEAPGIIENEKVWKLLHEIDFQDDALVFNPDLEGRLSVMHDELRNLGPYWIECDRASRIWRRLIAERLCEKSLVVETYESPFPACQKCHKGYDAQGYCGCSMI